MIRGIHSVVGEIECNFSSGVEFIEVRTNWLADIFKKIMKGLEMKPAKE